MTCQKNSMISDTSLAASRKMIASKEGSEIAIRQICPAILSHRRLPSRS